METLRSLRPKAVLKSWSEAAYVMESTNMLYPAIAMKRWCT